MAHPRRGWEKGEEGVEGGAGACGAASGRGAGFKSGIDDTSCKAGFDFMGHFQPGWEMTLTQTDALLVH